MVQKLRGSAFSRAMVSAWAPSRRSQKPNSFRHRLGVDIYIYIYIYIYIIVMYIYIYIYMYIHI